MYLLPTTCIARSSSKTSFLLIRNLNTANTSKHLKAVQVRQRQHGGWLTRKHWKTYRFEEQREAPLSKTPTWVLSTQSASDEDSILQAPKELDKGRTDNFLELAKEKLVHAFLPKGYPSSVTPEYANYAGWQFVHSIAGSVTGVLSMQSLLYAVGLGAGAIPLAAALNWIIKDGLGQLGGVIYAALIGNRFDSEPKRHRFQAVLALQAASLLELATPMVPGLFLPLASISNIGKNIAWLASSATRAQMHSTFAQRDNLGDITGKSGSQGTAAGLIGTAIGIVTSACIASDPFSVFLAFVPFSVTTIYANYRSLNFVVTRTLNIQRAERIMHLAADTVINSGHLGRFRYRSAHIISSSATPMVRYLYQLTYFHDQDPNTLPNSHTIAARETFIRRYQSPFAVHLELEPSVSENQFLQRELIPSFISALAKRETSPEENYFIAVVPRTRQPRNDQGDTKGFVSVCLWYDVRATPTDELKGFWHACLLRRRLDSTTRLLLTAQGEEASAKWDTEIRASYDDATNSFSSLRAGLAGAGWSIENVFFAGVERRMEVVYV